VDHLLLHWDMPRRVVDLFACGWTAGSTQSVVVWKMMPSCIFVLFMEGNE
jgi:hypothetical protein